MKYKMSQLVNDQSPDMMQEIESSQEYEDIMIKYMDYTDSTLRGEYGNMARYWMTYVHLVLIYHKFNNIELFIHAPIALRQMIPVSFTANRLNYSRWKVHYYFNLINMEETQAGITEVLANGALSIHRTDKSFSRSPIDLTLEQTINADAASCQTGIAAFSS